MDTTIILIVATAILFAGVWLYIKKSKSKNSNNTNQGSGRTGGELDNKREEPNKRG
jgi:hypothetical protein